MLRISLDIFVFSWILPGYLRISVRISLYTLRISLYTLALMLWLPFELSLYTVRISLYTVPG